MAFDGIFLRQIIKQLHIIETARINKIYQISDTEILFNLKAKTRYNLMISCHSVYNRIHITDRDYPTRPIPSNFIMLLRKHLEGGTIVDIAQADLDRYLIITIASRNELGDKIKSELYVELMGKYANLILVENGRIVDALKHIPPFENSKRTILPGITFKPAQSQPDKVNPFELSDIVLNDNLSNQLTGFSPLLANELVYRVSNGQKFTDFMREIDNSDSLYLTTIKNEEYFHCIPLHHLSNQWQKFEICEGLDYMYFTKEERERIRQQTGDLFKFTRKEIKKTESKLNKLNLALNEALDCDKWRSYGDALYANICLDTKGLTQVILKDYEENELTIPLDPKLDLKGNAKKCFQKYRKGINGQKFISEQIKLAEDNLAYFQLINEQLAQADFNSAAEIRSELESGGYLKAKPVKGKKKKQEEPHYQKISFNNKIIYCGKNNLQNDYLTFKKASRFDYWFHIKDMHGSHVILCDENPGESEIRFCAMLATYFSKARNSSSVPVNYTQVKNLKKIPGSKVGKVIMKEYSTIYIDVDEELIKQYVK